MLILEMEAFGDLLWILFRICQEDMHKSQRTGRWVEAPVLWGHHPLCMHLGNLTWGKSTLDKLTLCSGFITNLLYDLDLGRVMHSL